MNKKLNKKRGSSGLLHKKLLEEKILAYLTDLDASSIIVSSKEC